MIDISGHLRSHRRECGFSDDANYLTVNCCGYQKFLTRSFTRSRENGRLDYQLLYIVKGKGVFRLDGRFVTVPEGNIVVYHPGQPQFYRYSHLDATEVYWVHFTGSGAAECLKKSCLDGQPVYFIGVSSVCTDLYKKIMVELQVKRPMHDSLAGAYLLALLSQMARKNAEVSAGVNREKDSNLQKIIEYMHSAYHTRCSVRELAQRCGLSTFRFMHNFKALTGMAPIEYLTTVRVDKAKDLLLSSSLHISEISGVVGYENPLYFSRIFKKATGMSPSGYRKHAGV